MAPAARLDARYAKFRGMGRYGEAFIDDNAGAAAPPAGQSR